jgi:anti-sigma-K factor RskA
MSAESKIDELVTRYVLGELSEAEERSIEDNYALDPDFSELVNAAEDDLVDAYVLNRLSPEKREQFERFFLVSPENREKVAFIEVLLRHMEPDSMGENAPALTKSQISAPLPPPSAHGLSRFNLASRFALAVVLLVAVGGGLWLFMKDRNSTPSVVQKPVPTPLTESETKRQLTVESQNNQAATTKAEQNGQSSIRQTVPRSKHKPVEKPSPIIASFILSPGLTRAGDDTTRIEIAENVELVELKLNIDSTRQYAIYRGSLQQVGGRVIWNGSVLNKHLKPLRRIALKVPVHVLTNSEYLLTVTGKTPRGSSEVVGDYPFMVEKQIKQ